MINAGELKSLLENFEIQNDRYLARWIHAALFVLCVTSYANFANAQSVDEIPATIIALNIADNNVTLGGLGLVETTYRMAFDIVIKLQDGSSGTANNLRKGDGVSALVAADGEVVHALYVVSRS